MKEKKERKLSKAELKRKEEFDALTEKLVAEGYTPNHQIMGVFAANVLALVVVLPFVVALFVLYYAAGNKFIIHSGWDNIIVLGVFLVLIVAHELIHGLTWASFVEGGWKSISFGFIAEYMTPYCSCNQPMKKSQIIIGAFMPTLILGFLPCIVATFLGSSVLFAIGILMIFGGGGDILIIFKLLAYKSPSKDVLFIDHPFELGTAVFEKR